jgi:hypothetical protein
MSEIEQRALEIWREREKMFPERVQRDPDDLDRANGAWQLCLDHASRSYAEPADGYTTFDPEVRFDRDIDAGLK